MILTIKNIITACIFILLPINALAADTRVFFEGGEATSYTTHFLEDQFGSSESTYWAEFIAEIQQSVIHHSGSYSITYDPYTDRNPYCQTGMGSTTYGNLDDVDFTAYSNRYWYFRWYQYWGEGTNLTSGGAGNKIFYLGCGGDYYYLSKTEDTNNGFLYKIGASVGGETISYGWVSVSIDLYDQTWHKIEIFVDFGSSNAASDGSTWIQIDDTQLAADSGLDFNTLPNPVGCLAWPSNCSLCTGSQDVYLDDMEVWVLDAALSQGDTEPLYGAEPTPQPTTQASGNFSMSGN